MVFLTWIIHCFSTEQICDMLFLVLYIFFVPAYRYRR